MKDIRVESYNIIEFNKKFAKLKKIATQAGIKFDIEVSDLITHTNLEGNTFEYHMISIPEIAPRVGNYSVVGHKEYVTIEKSSFDKVCMFDEKHTVQFHKYSCDHCKTNRQRKSVFMLQNNDNQEYIQVGSTCLNTFTNTTSLKYFVNYLSLFEELMESERESLDREPDLYSTKYIFQLTAFVMDTHQGGIYRKTSQEDSTAELIKILLLGNISDRPINDMLDKYKEESAAVNKYFKDNNGSGDYINNLRNFAFAGSCRFKDIGLVCSAVSVYRGILERNKANAAQSSSEHVGEVGSRDIFTLKYVKTVSQPNSFGMTFFHTFETSYGSVVVNKSSKNLECDFGEVEVGDYLTFKATIKQHKEYNGIKSTVINRVAVVESKAG